jgi:hypothetical protein
MKPFRLRRWRPRSSSQDVQFFTCARPGRSGKSESRHAHVPDSLVHEWVRGLPGRTDIVIISLLGRKDGPDGVSEFSFYSFHGQWDSPAERVGRLSFQDWLNRYHKDRFIQVLEYPTYDFRRIERQTLDAVASDISDLLLAGRTVVLIDSGGQTRTGQICKHIRFVEDTRNR